MKEVYYLNIGEIYFGRIEDYIRKKGLYIRHNSSEYKKIA